MYNIHNRKTHSTSTTPSAVSSRLLPQQSLAFIGGQKRGERLVRYHIFPLQPIRSEQKAESNKSRRTTVPYIYISRRHFLMTSRTQDVSIVWLRQKEKKEEEREKLS